MRSGLLEQAQQAQEAQEAQEAQAGVCRWELPPWRCFSWRDEGEGGSRAPSQLDDKDAKG